MILKGLTPTNTFTQPRFQVPFPFSGQPKNSIPHVSEVKRSSESAPSIEFLALFALGSDALVIALAFFLATFDHTAHGFKSAIREIILGPFSGYILVGTALYMVTFGILGGYNRHQFFNRGRTFYTVLRASYYCVIIFLALTFALKLQPGISRYFFVWSFFNTWLFLSLWRLGFSELLRKSGWQSSLRERVLVVGWSKESHLLTSKILMDPAHPYEVIGCTPSAHGKFWVTPPSEIPVLGDYNSLEEIMREHQPNIMIAADLDPVMGEMIALADLCVREHVQFKVIPSYFQTFSSGLHLEHVSGVPVVGVSKLPLDHVANRIIKRALDVVGSIVGLILSVPLILIFGYLIRRESPGPIFYSQVRTGQNGRDFRIYKLRSMKLNAEMHGVGWTKENDTRRLQIGGVMRKWNVDEIPQFWNVLVGDMSLVGPRPERPEHIHNLKNEITHYNARHFAKPGLTGFAQINGMRGDTDLTARVRYDLYYLENWNVFLDIYIMFKTFFVRSNAY
jgi:exopolysaccharide biosynthesis polyprenyl glycosylphosphotransferase